VGGGGGGRPATLDNSCRAHPPEALPGSAKARAPLVFPRPITKVVQPQSQLLRRVVFAFQSQLLRKVVFVFESQ
jgi:hypothetical protein